MKKIIEKTEDIIMLPLMNVFALITIIKFLRKYGILKWLVNADAVLEEIKEYTEDFWEKSPYWMDIVFGLALWAIIIIAGVKIIIAF